MSNSREGRILRPGDCTGLPEPRVEKPVDPGPQLDKNFIEAYDRMGFQEVKEKYATDSVFRALVDQLSEDRGVFHDGAK